MYIYLYKPLTKLSPVYSVDQPFPSFTLPKSDGSGQFITQQAMQGKPGLVNIWAIKNFSSQVEHKFLLSLAKQGVPIYGINHKESSAQIKIWAKNQGSPYLWSVNDAKGMLTKKLGVTEIPETFIIDSKGMIRFHHVGALDAQAWNDIIRPQYEALVTTNTR